LSLPSGSQRTARTSTGKSVLRFNLSEHVLLDLLLHNFRRCGTSVTPNLSDNKNKS